MKVVKYNETDENMSEKTINKIIHARYDMENNGFYEPKDLEKFLIK
ncbi:MAG: hypothetical protein IJH12_10920 [Clostridia bacterium]|nr:hypothetical protein [Clostridia bacterium]